MNISVALCTRTAVSVASVVFSMSEEKRESIQQESTSIIMSSDDPLPSQDDQTSTCETSNYVGIADGRGANNFTAAYEDTTM